MLSTLSNLSYSIARNKLDRMVPGLHVLRLHRLAVLSFPTTIFSPVSTPAHTIFGLSLFVFAIAGGIFLVVGSLLVYAMVKFRSRPGDTTEPPQVFGSTQIELAWTIIPILIIVVLFLATVRVIFSVQDAPKPASALDVVVIGHQFWWEFRYPKYNVVTANELHVPLSTTQSPMPTFLKLTSADVIHSFWVPRLAGKTDLLPNRVNEMWIEPQSTGMYDGQCAQFCGSQHAHMLLRVYVDTPEQFRQWIANQQKLAAPVNPPLAAVALLSPGSSKSLPANTPGTIGEAAGTTAKDDSSSQINAAQGRHVFEQQACINCHAVRGTIADGRFGPDLTHLMSRQTIAAGAAANTPENLMTWITAPATLKSGALMPAMHLTEVQNQQITAYLTTLH